MIEKPTLWKSIKNGFGYILNNRVILLALLVGFLFYVLFVNLYNLQILSSLEYTPPARRNNIVRTVAMDAPRGRIFDRLGRPLAVNVEVAVIKIDPAAASARSSVSAVIEFIRLARLFGEEIVVPSTIPVTHAYPYEFTVNSVTQRVGWLHDMTVIEHRTATEEVMEITAEEALDYLYAFFRIPDELPPGMYESDRRLVLEIVSAIFMQRNWLNQITIARNVGPRIIAAVEERGAEMPNFYSDVEYLRHYPAGKYVAHLIGYIRPINSADYERFGELGYSMTDLFGVTGVERAFEVEHLRGMRGTREVVSDPFGRRMSNTVINPPVAGSDIFLTIDLELQMTAVNSLERVLTELLAAKIMGAGSRDDPFPVTVSDVMNGLLRTNSISIAQIMESETGYQRTVRNFVENFGGELADNNGIRNFIMESVADGRIRAQTMVGVLIEQGVVTATPSEAERLGRNALPLQTFISGRVLAGEITPQMAHIEPVSGSVVVTCVHTGAIIAAANYPNYDNNYFANTFDNAYFARMNSDPTSPLLNRAFQTNRPPGSTFKMITALAGLESGIITPTTVITTSANCTFTKAGTPHVRCWIARWNTSHGSLNVVTALEVSCNYFFFETAWRMGNTTNNRMLQGLDVLSEWMRKFGLDTPSGVEVGNRVTILPSPEFKEYRAWITGQQLIRRQREWNDNDTVTTAIGQNLNNYNTVVMAKYIATLANGGDRYQSHLLQQIRDSAGNTTFMFEPVLEESIDINPRNLTAVFNGMYRVLYGLNGTARNEFDDFPIAVGSKTGTAQTLTTVPSDLSFAAFAPFDNPQIAVYVMIPFGDNPHYSLPAAKITRDVLACYFKVGTDTENNTADSQRNIFSY